MNLEARKKNISCSSRYVYAELAYLSLPSHLAYHYTTHPIAIPSQHTGCMHIHTHSYGQVIVAHIDTYDIYSSFIYAELLVVIILTCFLCCMSCCLLVLVHATSVLANFQATVLMLCPLILVISG